MRRFKVVVVEGIIGVGKSHFSDELALALTSIGGGHTLTMREADQEAAPGSFHNEFYAEMQEEDETKWKNWATLFQFDQLSRRYSQHKLAQGWAKSGRGCAILDRSLYGDTCFANMLNNPDEKGRKRIPDSLYDLYERIYGDMTEAVLLPHVMVRLTIRPEHSIERIRRRGSQHETRASEVETVSVAYQRALDREIGRLAQVLKKLDVLVLDVPWDADRDTVEMRSRVIESIADRIIEHEPTELFLNSRFSDRWRRSI